MFELIEMEVTLRDIENAQTLLKDVVKLTPLEKSRTLSKLTGMNLYLKLENLQRTGSFKLRGAYNKIHSLSDSERRRGVVAASAGNHAQGVARAAALLDVKSTIVMPVTASPAKVDATRGYGAKVILHGVILDETFEMAKRIALREGATFVHPFDDPKVIAGQGTIGLEMIDSEPDLDVIVAPIGGGGLISGVSVAAKALKPSIRIIGVQSEAFPAMYMTFKGKRFLPRDVKDTIADGIAVKQPGRLTSKLIKRLVDDIVLVGDNDIARSILMLLERMKLVAEPAGAVSVAACFGGLIKAKEKNCAAILSGGNIDMYILDQVVSKGLEMEHRLLNVSVALSDKPGALNHVLGVIAESRANVISIEHDRIGREIPVGAAKVTLHLETQNEQHTKTLIAAMRKAKLKYQIVS